MRDQNNGQSLIAIGNELLSAGQYKEAVEAYQKVLQHDDDDTTNFIAHFQMGWCYYLLSDIIKAERNLIAAQMLQPENPRVMLSLAAIDFFKESLLSSRRFEQTIEKLDRLKSLLDSAHDKQEFMPDYLSFKARVITEMGNLLEAEKLVDYITSKYPEHHASQMAFAHLLQKKKSFREAYEAYEKILSLNPFLSTAYEGLARCAFTLNNAKKAQSVLEGLLVSYPDLHFLHYWQGWLYWQTRDYQRAYISLNRSVELCSTNAYGHYYLGCTLLRLLKPLRARKHFDASTQLLLSYVSKPTLDYCYSLRGAAIANLMCLNWVQGIKLAWASLSTMQRIFLTSLQKKETD